MEITYIRFDEMVLGYHYVALYKDFAANNVLNKYWTYLVNLCNSISDCRRSTCYTLDDMKKHYSHRLSPSIYK